MEMHVNDSPVEYNADFDRLVRQEDLLLEVTETLTQALDDAGMTRTELAQRLGRTPGYVSQVFGGGRNLTLRTVADIATALSMRPILKLVPDDEFGRTDRKRKALRGELSVLGAGVGIRRKR